MLAWHMSIVNAPRMWRSYSFTLPHAPFCDPIDDLPEQQLRARTPPTSPQAPDSATQATTRPD
ncbi:hypothetical protein GCM10017674_78410 [Streptomyces gardneri]|uniref:Uncharacterized protein n=1 Tax=Streptomyces gardneri TaxID=66892 RepID=A0A4Y3RII1_9ACTN|nr:hypothetical protein SGA01_27840 [Streptomyces gardneri]GHH22551.1 hypothetical protein GCM10017674_78410 [Streptomyces gardneri]